MNVFLILCSLNWKFVNAIYISLQLNWKVVNGFVFLSSLNRKVMNAFLFLCCLNECFLFLSSVQLKMVNTFYISCIIYWVYITMLGISMQTTLQYKTKVLHIKNRGFELCPLIAFFLYAKRHFRKALYFYNAFRHLLGPPLLSIF